MPEYTPNVPTATRDKVYIGGLLVAAFTGLIVTVVSVIVPDVAPQAAAIGTAILTASGIITAGLGTVYRPGAQKLG